MQVNASSSVEEVAAMAVRNELVREWGERLVGALRIQILTPTQSAMDRLAAFYHWRDRQGLDQAVSVSGSSGPARELRP